MTPKTLGRVLVGLAVLLPVAGCTSDDSALKVRVDHSTAAPPVRLADAGPVPGSLTESWHVDAALLTNGFGSTDRPKSPLVLDGQLVVASSPGLDVYDATTGKERWHYREPGRILRGYAATAGALVAMTSSSDEPDDQLLSRRIGLDAGTGRVLWTSRDKGVGFPETTSDELVASGGVVPMLKQDFGDDVFGVDARTGHTRWTHDNVGGRGCETNDLSNQGSDGSLLVFAQKCHDQDRILALDPATGRERWRKDVTAYPSRVSVSGGLALVSDTDGSRLFAADGRELGAGKIACVLVCTLRATPGHAVVTPAGDLVGGTNNQAPIVDTRTGQVTALHIGESYLALTVVGGQMYGLHEHVFASRQAELLPSGLDVIDPADATVQPRPLPFAMSSRGDAPGEPSIDWMAVAGGRLFTKRVIGKTVRVTAYATTRPGEPAALGGVREADWPDACHVAPGYRPQPYPKAAERVAAMGSTTLRDVVCMVQGDGANDGFATVQTGWVAASPEQAHALLAMPEKAQKEHVDNADEAYSIPDSSELWFRVGRYVMQVSAFQQRDRTKVASAVAKGLRRRTK